MATRLIYVDIMLKCGCVHVQNLDSMFEEVTIKSVWCDKHHLQNVVSISQPYRDMDSYVNPKDNTVREGETPFPLFDYSDE